jgi:methylthioribulose-1-phosphate dehydratase
MTNIQKYWVELADIKDELAARDWFPGTSGNLSIKVGDAPLQFLVTASGKDKRKRTSEDFILVDQYGCPIDVGTNLKPSAETAIHMQIYKHFKNIRCCLHVHTVENNVISELYGSEGSITFKGQELIKAFGIWEEDGEITIPIVENYTDIPKLASELIKHVDHNTFGVLIRNHGITTWGRNGFEAKRHLEAFEFLFKYHLTLKSLHAHAFI